MIFLAVRDIERRFPKQTKKLFSKDKNASVAKLSANFETKVLKLTN